MKGKKIKTDLGHPLWDQKELIDEKSQVQESHETAPLTFKAVARVWSLDMT